MRQKPFSKILENAIFWAAGAPSYAVIPDPVVMNTTGDLDQDDSTGGNKGRPIVGIILGVVFAGFFFIIVIVLLLILLRRKSMKKKEETHLDVYKSSPSHYEGFIQELPRNSVRVDKVIGEGNYGKVYKGKCSVLSDFSLLN